MNNASITDTFVSGVKNLPYPVHGIYGLLGLGSWGLLWRGQSLLAIALSATLLVSYLAALFIRGESA